MDDSDLVRDYVLLGLRFDRLVDGFVDAFTGDPALRHQVANEPSPDPARLALHARRLADRLPAAGLDAARERFLGCHLAALECSARRLAGEAVAFPAEVSAYFDVDIAPGDPEEYRRAHLELAGLLPGDDPLAERLAAFRSRDEIPPARLAEAVQAISSALRDRVRERFDLPAAEVVDYEVVTDQSWSGFNFYLGNYRSRVAINADVGVRMSQLPHLIAHESYPGHHTEHCRKEAGLVVRHGHAEQTIFLVNTPQCLMAEGLADLGLHAAIGPGWGGWAQEIFADLGLRFEGELAQRLERATGALVPVRQDAALMLHDRGASQDEVVEYLCRWLLVPDAKARQMLRFLAHPLWRAYTSTYVEGYRLLRRWLDARPPLEQLDQRYLRLLDEPLVPSAIRAEIDA